MKTSYFDMPPLLLGYFLNPLLMILLCLLAMLTEYPSLPLYLAIFLVIYPVTLCSMILRWEEQQLLYREVSTTVTGRATQYGLWYEQRHYLSGIYFFSSTGMAEKLTLLALLKLCCGLALIALNIGENIYHINHSLGNELSDLVLSLGLSSEWGNYCSLTMGLAIFVIIARQFVQDYHLYYQCRYHHYQEHCSLQDGRYIYSAKTIQPQELTQGHTPILDALLKVPAPFNI